MFNLSDTKVILASSSPRRIELLSSLGIEFDKCSPDIDETIYKGEHPKQYAARMAITKAQVIAEKNSDKIIIAADTSVFHGKKLLDKAKTNEDVKEFLTYLGGRKHSVYSGLAVIFPNNKISHRVVETKVKIKKLSKQELDFYINSGEGIDKAGGYAIQGLGATLISSISGSYHSVVGLPLYELSQILKGSYDK